MEFTEGKNPQNYSKPFILSLESYFTALRTIEDPQYHAVWFPYNKEPSNSDSSSNE